DHRKLMAIAALAARILAPALLEGDHFVTARMLEHLASNGRACNGRRAKLWCVASNQQHLAELDDLARLAGDPVDPDQVFRSNSVLFAACLDDCKHLSSSRARSGGRIFRTGLFQSVCSLLLRA